MKLSITIPTYNRKKQLKNCIDSILKQKISNSEIIVIDDNSSDGTFDFIKKNYPKIKIFKNKKNMMPGYSRNLGFEKSSGDKILFVDSDVTLEKDAVKNLLKYDEDIIHPLIKYDSGLKMYPNREKEKENLYITTVFLAKKDSLKKLDSLFDPYYFNYEDLDFFLRCNFFGLKMKYCPEAVAIHHEHKKQEDWEHRHYCELYGILYGMLKLRKILKNTKMKNDFNFSILTKKIICSLFNFNSAHYYIEYGKTSNFKKIKDILFSKRKISNSTLKVYYITIKAFYKSFLNLSCTLKQKNKIEKFIRNN